MSRLLHQIKLHRKALGMRQQDMLMRIGMARQQYQRLETNGNPRLDTLELIAKGLGLQVMLIPEDKVLDVQAFIDDKKQLIQVPVDSQEHKGERPVSDDPWQGLLEDVND